MGRKVFYSFHYEPDNWRASTIRSIGKVEGNNSVKDNEWETIKKGGDKSIRKWIDEQLNGRSCSIVLIGKDTAGRKWIDYEIEKSWNDAKGLLGIYIHGMKNREGYITNKGSNPFSDFTMQKDDSKLSSIVSTYNPVGSNSKERYRYIADHIEQWVEDAVRIRKNY